MKRTSMPVGVVTIALVILTSLRGGDAPPLKYSEDEQKLLELTNLERKKKELAPVKAQTLLSKVARGHSENMARQGKMEHSLDSKTPFDRLREAGYLFARGGENIAAADPSVRSSAILKAWLESPGHRENILSPEYTEIGIGLATDPDGKIYYTQVFARPREKD